MSDLNTAILLMLVGMLAVFTILALVVSSGHFLIYIINKFFPVQEVKKPKRATLAVAKPSSKQQGPALAAIVSTVDLLTEGKGKIKRIEKLN